jgi:hypothetical protein
MGLGRIVAMSGDVGSDLEELGRAAAETVAGAGAVEQVEVEDGADSSDRPVYYFSFLIDWDRSQKRPGLLYSRLVQRLRDDLVARGDDHLPLIRIFDRKDWYKRANAGPG